MSVTIHVSRFMCVCVFWFPLAREVFWARMTVHTVCEVIFTLCVVVGHVCLLTGLGGAAFWWVMIRTFSLGAYIAFHQNHMVVTPLINDVSHPKYPVPHNKCKTSMIGKYRCLYSIIGFL